SFFNARKEAKEYRETKAEAESLGIKDFEQKVLTRATEDPDYKKDPAQAYDRPLKQLRPMLELLEPLKGNKSAADLDAKLQGAMDGTMTLDKVYEYTVLCALGPAIRGLSPAEAKKLYVETLKAIYKDGIPEHLQVT